MRLVTVLVCIAAVLSCAWAEDVVCKKRTKTSVQVGDGESFSFKTQGGREYKPKSRCIVKYKKSSSCPSMRFSCSKFSLKARNPSCTKGDKMLVVMDGKAKRFCQGNPPNITTSGDMKIVFISNRASQSSGAECSVECVSGQDGTPGNTGNCPRERPEFNSPCNSSEDRSRCEYGTQTCCGETFPDFVMQCMEDNWTGVQMETPCFSGATCGPVTANCPGERPEFNSPCNSSEDGPRCEYGNQTCCGESFPDIAMECMEDTWAGIAVETPCFLQGHSCGPVTKPPPQNCICPEIYEPVCGTNGQTYSNTCFARCEAQTAACEGECPCTSDCICLAVFSPVCGADGQTYSNGCQAGCANAKVSCEGECPCSSDCICPAVFSPVCGADGQTYSNSCQAGCANAGVGCEGECPCA